MASKSINDEEKRSDSQRSFRKLLTLLTQLYTLLSTIIRWFAANIIRRIHGIMSLTPRPSRHSNSDEFAKLARIWGMAEKSKVIFTAIEVHTLDEDSSTVVGVGLCSWCLDNISPTESVYWQINSRSNIEVQRCAKIPSLFVYGPTKHLEPNELGSFLSTTFNQLTSRYQVICLAGYQLATKIALLRGIWSPPPNVIEFDVYRIFQGLYDRREDVSLKEYAKEVSYQEYAYNFFDNAGNAARAIMDIVHAQGSKSTTHKPGKQD
ncbi:hypothetical protein F4860DRAFT_517024 [Xylaria cubensis]|nr:hypothetical protein F4860DRAFT_517024 [Xylaria cubensis]